MRHKYWDLTTVILSFSQVQNCADILVIECLKLALAARLVSNEKELLRKKCISRHLRKVEVPPKVSIALVDATVYHPAVGLGALLSSYGVI